MPETLNLQTCGKCGTTLSGYAPDGLCAACLLESAFEERSLQPAVTARSAQNFKLKDYELFEEIARGGMGVVYRARQISLRRPVAIKMILGGHLANAAEVQRFRAEAGTAAQLRHPNIVAIHEVGEHAGQPFFTMDLVEGRSFAQLVRDEPPPVRKAAVYLKTIADAVQYAHSRGVLHRDLKPSNILIDETDQPRITDFGLAKRFEVPPSGGGGGGQGGATLKSEPAESGNPNELTQTGQVLGSPSFIPPEQASGQKAAFGPASDVYSLGAILYHSLTARPPFVAETLAQTLRMVAEMEPVSPRLLNASVPRDLETICLKCLEKDPKRRYPTAQELSDDLACFLRDEPIRARPISSTARLWRWCRRKPALASAVALLLVVAIGSPIAAFYINRERLRAETEATKSRQVTRFLTDMLEGVGPSAALGRDTTLLKEILDKTATRLAEELQDQPELEAELRNTLGEVYYSIGQIKQAEAMHRRALALRKQLWGKDNLATAGSQHNLGLALYAQNEGPEAEALLREALATRSKLLGDENLVVAESLNSLGRELAEHNQGGEAETVFREAISIRRKLLKEHPELAASLNSLSKTLSDEGRHVEAESLAREALEMQRKFLGDEHPDVAISLHALATALLRQGKFLQAESFQREGLAIQRKLLGTMHPNVVRSLSRLAEVLSDEGKHVEAEAAQREGLAMLEKIYGRGHQALDWPHFSLAIILQKAGRLTEAERLMRETIGDVESKPGADLWLSVSALNNLGDLIRDQSKWSEANALYLRALATVAKLPSSPRAELASCWAISGVIFTLSQQGKLEEAESALREALANRAATWLDHPYRLELSLNLLMRLGKYQEAEQIFTNAPLSARLDGSASLRRTRGDLRARFGRWNEAAADFEKAVELEPENVENYHRLAPLLVQSGRVDAYRENCRRALQQFANTQSPAVAERVAKDCLMLPTSNDQLEGGARMADLAVSTGTNHRGINWIRATKGLAEYRQGRWSSSVDWVQLVLASSGVNERDAQAYLVLAMAKHHLGLPDEARAALTKAVEFVEAKLPKLEKGDLGELWSDWIIAHFLLSEAKALIQDGGIGQTEVPAVNR